MPTVAILRFVYFAKPPTVVADNVPDKMPGAIIVTPVPSGAALP